MSHRQRNNKSVKYSSLPTEDRDPIEEDEAPDTIGEKVIQWLHAFFWVILAVISWRYTKIYQVLSTDERISSTLLKICIGLISVNCALFLYLGFISAIVSTYEKTFNSKKISITPSSNKLVIFIAIIID